MVVTIAAGQTGFNIPVSAIQDLLIEGDETIIVTIISAIGAALGVPITQTATIIDDDVAVVNITGGTTIFETGGTAPIMVYLSG